MWSSLTCFCTFCRSAVPTSCYILNVFYYLFMSLFLAASAHACSSWGLPSHSSRSLSQAATDIWTIESSISYTDSIGWRITGPSVLSNTDSTLLWMDDKASSPCLKTGGTHRSRHSKTSLNRSDIFIIMTGTYLSLFKCLVRLTTQHILCFFDRPPMSRYSTCRYTANNKHQLNI